MYVYAPARPNAGGQVCASFCSSVCLFVCLLIFATCDTFGDGKQPLPAAMLFSGVISLSMHHAHN